jgi:hypothetical protein
MFIGSIRALHASRRGELDCDETFKCGLLLTGKALAE